MAQQEEIVLWIDQRWKRAIEKHLRDETLQEHLENVLDELCNQLPEREYERISHAIQSEAAAQRAEEEAARTYAAYHVTERGQEWYFKTSPGEELLTVGKKLRSYITSEKAAVPDLFIKMFAGGRPITAEEYNALTAVRIDRDVVTAFVQEKLLYEDDPHHNCVFVGLDENGEARHAHLRSTGSQGKVFRINVESSDIKHSFHKNGTDRSLYVFEAPIDLLSHITLYPAGWLEHSYVACCGTSIQPVLERLRQNPKLDTVYLCLDNDEAGEDACDGMLDTLEDMGYDVERLRPEGKDWNDDLRAKRGGHG